MSQLPFKPFICQRTAGPTTQNITQYSLKKQVTTGCYINQLNHSQTHYFQKFFFMGNIRLIHASKQINKITLNVVTIFRKVIFKSQQVMGSYLKMFAFARNSIISCFPLPNSSHALRIRSCNIPPFLLLFLNLLVLFVLC